jgi:hypothetical protein
MYHYLLVNLVNSSGVPDPCRRNCRGISSSFRRTHSMAIEPVPSLHATTALISPFFGDVARRVGG